jgi:hypothetical protein
VFATANLKSETLGYVQPKPSAGGRPISNGATAVAFL